MAFVMERDQRTGFSTSYEFRCTSRDEKPTEYNNGRIPNMSVVWEVDTGELYYFDWEDNDWHVCG